MAKKNATKVTEETAVRASAAKQFVRGTGLAVNAPLTEKGIENVTVTRYMQKKLAWLDRHPEYMASMRVEIIKPRGEVVIVDKAGSLCERITEIGANAKVRILKADGNVVFDKVVVGADKASIIIEKKNVVDVITPDSEAETVNTNSGE